ncbi:alpha-N-arabinofuranosidase [Sphingomonas hengshuiensis]|uniref:non-reducing end alpha-L-arabinofuranosidase n=1 Tax=Sphingomonas hengshuiensis TaxID=1609977 RepID=A0A7U4LFQ5_9SPHN|nr:alpha-L-arabinofuranosidase C-terminal domain-containing protein [Sphingomonas hengshuiensis]AJP72508.1 alpha-N-arabinofuranosidase [Sphingomonas hengshuiensis]
MQRSRPLTAALLLLLASAAPIAAHAQSNAPVAMTIDAGKPGPKIDRNIFGQFAEHLGTGIYGGVWVGKDSPIPNVRGIRKDVVAALRAIRVPNVRWPGGCFADEYHWRHGIGPAEKRHNTINSNWGDSVEPNSFGTDEFFDFVDQIGSEAYVSVNVGSGTVQEAADWMAYMTADPTTTAGKERAANGHPAPYKVKYLGIGNEAWGCGGSMTPDHYVDTMKPFARFTRNFNPAQTGAETMQRIAVGPDGEDTGYTEAVMKAYKGHNWAWSIEGLSLHSYTTAGWPPSYASENFDEGAYARLVKATYAMDGMITKHSAIMDKYDPEKKVPLVVDEWGVWLKPTAGTNPGFLQQQNSMRDAIIAAVNVNIFARHADRVRMTNIAQMINVLQAMILTDKDKMVLTPTYHVFKMYLPFQDATFVPATFDAGTYKEGDVTLPRIDAIAARDTGGKLWIAVTNLDPRNPAQVRASVAGVKLRSVSGQLLTAPRVDSVNSFAAPNAVAPKPYSAKASGDGITLEVPAKSVLVVQVES